MSKLYCVTLRHSDLTGGRQLFDTPEAAKECFDKLTVKFEGSTTQVGKQVINSDDLGKSYEVSSN